MVFRDADEAAVRWEVKPRFYTRTEDRILSIIKQAHHVTTAKEHSLSYKVGYLEGCLESIKHSIEFPECY